MTSPRGPGSRPGSGPDSSPAPAQPPAGLPTLAVAGGVATLRLNRPQRRNALTDADLQWLLATLAQVDADASIRLLVLAADTGPARADGRPPVWCAGYDVAGFDAPEHDPQAFERVPDALAALRPLTLALLDGSVHGGATDLVMACDLWAGVRGGRLHLPAAALGLHYYPSGLQRFVQRLGPSLARRMVLAAQPLGFEALEAAGLFTLLAAPERWAAEAQALVDRLAGLAPLAVQGMKQSLREIERGTLDLPRLRAREQATLASADFAEGRAALRAGRPPHFTGA